MFPYRPVDEREIDLASGEVVLTRRTCPWLTFGEVSKRAFDLLHRHYPASPWTEKTPYWYGN